MSDVPRLPSLAKDAEGSLEERQELLEERLEYFDGTRGRMRFFKAYQEALTDWQSKADAIWKRSRTTRNRSHGTLIKYWWTWCRAEARSLETNEGWRPAR